MYEPGTSPMPTKPFLPTGAVHSVPDPSAVTVPEIGRPGHPPTPRSGSPSPTRRRLTSTPLMVPRRNAGRHALATARAGGRVVGDVVVVGGGRGATLRCDVLHAVDNTQNAIPTPTVATTCRRHDHTEVQNARSAVFLRVPIEASVVSRAGLLRCLCACGLARDVTGLGA
jgi:hypothetical protein